MFPLQEIPTLLGKYDVAAPRYTSYPPATAFHDDFDRGALTAAIEDGNRQATPLSLYFHLPFCPALCYYCACNKVITAKPERVDSYVQRLVREIRQRGELFSRDRKVMQLHWGGGTPSYIGPSGMTQLVHTIASNFSLNQDPERDYSIELDPREADFETIALLKGLGFNRISLGVQDFDPEVQKTINRVQPEEMTRSLTEYARKMGFDSIHYDLIYGLPKQRAAGFRDTIEKVIRLAPDRISLFSYAHLPERFKAQRLFDIKSLPTAGQKLHMLVDAIEKLTAAGYVHIGFDHFAREDDPMVAAQQKGVLHRNFQGYSMWGGLDLLGMGVSSISSIGDTYAQNFSSLKEWGEAVEQRKEPTARGYTLTADDQVRSRIIQDLCVKFGIDFGEYATTEGIDFADRFGDELQRLEPYVADGCLRITYSGIRVTEKGRFVIRQICSAFDTHLVQATRRGAIYSRAI